MKPRTMILTGTTASGKTALAIDLALELGNIEIINADSMLVYRGMDIGTAKPSREERRGVPHHLIDIRDPAETFTAGDFVRAAREALAEIEARGKRGLIVGGTGFYLKALLFGLWDAEKGDPEVRKRFERRTDAELLEELRRLDPDSAARIGGNDRYRLVRALEIHFLTGKTPTELQKKRPQEPDPDFILCVTDRPNPELQKRISVRTSRMLEEGFVEEVRKIRAAAPSSRALLAVGYAQIVDFLDGKTPPGRKVAPGLEGLKQEIELATRQLVKRQRTWFRGQKDAAWFILDRDLESLRKEVLQVYSA